MESEEIINKMIKDIEWSIEYHESKLLEYKIQRDSLIKMREKCSAHS